MLEQLHTTYSDATAARALIRQCRARVVRWRWATASMAFDPPFSKEKHGGPTPRWVADDKAKPGAHIRHGLDADGRVVIECEADGNCTAWLHGPEGRHSLSFDEDACLTAAWAWRERGGRLHGLDLIDDTRGFNETYHWEGEQLQRVVVENWSRRAPTWWCQNVFTYNDAGQLDTIVLEYLTAEGRPTGERRLEYQRPRPGETLATVTAEVERLLIDAIAAQLPRIPRDEPLYCLLLCFTEEDTPSAWPPFLVWGRQSYRDEVMARGEEVHYYLWAPDEIREVQGDAHEHWFTEPALTEVCQRHNQYMELRQSSASANRVLRQVAAWLDAPERRAQLVTTDDFVVAVADNTGAVNPLPAMRKAIGAERWALLKSRGYV
ncbi:hypothetical protein ACLB90_03130 [Stenotrophomonas sp. LGBM10]|uniref:hypothetical protein n=1 Tax=Stenotrophomonas sp. LGBM10 TaxID=3390038 RepID=UPI00398B1559